MGKEVDANEARVGLMMMPGLIDVLLGDSLVGRLRRAGTVVNPIPVASIGELGTAQAAGIEVLLTSWGCGPIGARELAAMPRLKLVAHAAGTVKGIVTPELFEAGVIVTTAAPANAIPVAEATFAAIIMIGKDVFGIRDRHRRDRGRSRAIVNLATIGNNRRTVGIVGASTIGRLVIERLATIDCDVLLYDPFITSQEADLLGVSAVDLDILCARSDIVSIHAPALDATRHMIGAAQLAEMRDGAWLINTARGSLVDPVALEAELVSGRISALIDTPEPEPLPPESPLYDLDNVVLTPHIFGSLGNELPRMGELAVGEIERYVAGQPPLHPVAAADLETMA